MTRLEQILSAIMQLKLHGATPTKLLMTASVRAELDLELGRTAACIDGVPIEVYDPAPSVDSGRLLDSSGEEVIEEELAASGFFKKT